MKLIPYFRLVAVPEKPFNEFSVANVDERESNIRSFDTEVVKVRVLITSGGSPAR